MPLRSQTPDVSEPPKSFTQLREEESVARLQHFIRKGAPYLSETDIYSTEWWKREEASPQAHVSSASLPSTVSMTPVLTSL